MTTHIVTTQKAAPSMLSSAIKAAAAAIGPARIGLALILIAVIFQSLNQNFLSPANLSNLILQIVPIAMISIGIVLVLLLGEIDLSAGAVSGLAGAILAVSMVKWGWHPYASIATALLVGATIGFLHGLAIVSLRLPSFIVTLAGLMAWQGAQLLTLTGKGTIIVRAPEVVSLATVFLPHFVSIGGVAIVLAAYAFLQFARRVEQRNAGVEVEALARLLLKVVGVSVLTVVVLAVLLMDRGVPVGFLVVISTILLINYVLAGSSYGRHLLAVGGNSESARRVGIPVNRIKVAAFAAGSTLAAAGGILAVSRLQAATQSAGGSDLLLLAIAGPVIAGVSLFGGRGSVWGALVGAILIGGISNGMDLLGLDASIKYLITGGVLFLAVALDALARMRRLRLG
ncbi:ABC transporter permease [Aminobacter sp. MSH1]|uniref:sugar ABC transporter permease n=1 Tax=Aminobacter sp. MSH1 TaxID=374606 RepID=UPI000D363C6D|nr:ABC transporter permease [Aminobacter sp. MSH1]